MLREFDLKILCFCDIFEADIAVEWAGFVR